DVLRAMKRLYTRESYLAIIDELRTKVPGISITTDVIVGFPGESEANFAEGLAFVEEMRFAHAHLFPFSAREGTAAAAFAGTVSKEIKRRRLQQTQAVVAATGRAERARFAGGTRSVLFEGEGKPLADQPGRLWFGLTDNYLRVATVAPETVDLHNVLMPITLDGVEGDVMHGRLASIGTFAA
ncbi:MAG: hypothetical protein KDD77_10460, partial [Caldilineaceae bacterium]|nr:hypothetical protein [Caldilineaceae bacterium]